MTAALRIVDDGGLNALTMRRLADANKLQLPAIYRVFSNKQALLDEMAEAILAKVLPDSHEKHWEAEATLLAGQLRQALPAQREGTRIVGGSCAAKRHSLTLTERLVGVMQRAGFNGVSALWATSTVFCYALGEALEQQGLTDDAPDRLTFPDARRTYPQLLPTPVEEVLNFDDRFEFGLGLILGGLSGQLTQ
ncbi:TetR/AcrR family transcriptional regulator C-terminal domain-containing protein [Streptomyces sp. NBC_00989]|uniref:TetR/AcrR family transcriptional regulator C-terminal domain-containing protein n=1 Tax=Streptomyces sp. NBC_00989 TaxID=2903705 RepID=UPI0038651E9A|nr:TetR/AcrR family transcriptional regulator C-terminal domain-containing protein [Streptomyces sp. NBC_00989]